MALKLTLSLLLFVVIAINDLLLLTLILLNQAEFNSYLALSIIMAVSLMFINWFALRTILKNFSALMETATMIANGFIDIRIDKKFLALDDETGLISRAFFHLLLRLRQTRSSLEEKVSLRTAEIAKAKAIDEAMLSSIGDAIIAVDKIGDIIFINKSAENFFDWKEADIKGSNILPLLKLTKGKDEVSYAEHPVTLALKGQKVTRTLKDNFSYSPAGCEPVPVSLTVTPVFLNEETIGAISILRDITRDKIIDRAKTEFVSLASHQLRTPLSAINWYVEMLKNGEVGQLNADQKKYLETVYSSSQRMTDLVNSLLNLSRIELGSFSIEPQITDISQIIDKTVADIRPKVSAKKISLHIENPGNIPRMPLDVNLAGMIFLNLLTNAVKYSRPSGKITLGLNVKDPDLEISVKDNGIGIPKADQARIFSKFYRASNTAEIETEGNGLGLYIIKSILGEIGGRIWFTSEENSGTSFFVTIPLCGMAKKEGNRKLT